MTAPSLDPPMPDPGARSARLARLTVVGAVIGSLVWAVGPPGLLLGARATEVQLVKDSFDRTSPGGFGKADTGETWQTGGNAQSFDVASGYGSVELAGGAFGSALIGSTTARDVRVAVDVAVDRASSSAAQQAAVIVRRTEAGSYRVRLRFVSGTARLSAVEVSPDNVETLIGEEVTVPGAVSASTWWELEVEATGTGSTDLRARAWRQGSVKPAAFQLTESDSSPALQGAGSTGLYYSVARATTGSTTFHVDGLTVTELLASSQAPASPVSAPAAPARGAVLGSTSYVVPSGAVWVSPTGDDAAAGTASAPLRTILKGVQKVPSGGTVVVTSGTYREEVLFPYRKRATVQAAPGAVVWLDGSNPVSGFVASGSTWVKPGWTTKLDSTDPTLGDGAYWQMTNPAFPAAAHPDMVWVGGVKQTQVLSEDDVAPGTFYVDRAGSRLVLGSSPVGKTVDATVRDEAVYINHGHGSQLRGIGVRRYGTPLQRYGTVKLFADDVVLEDSVVIDSATRGVGILGARVKVLRSTVTGHGQLGLGATQSDGLVVRDSIVSRNNLERFNSAPEAGGIKITSSRDGTYDGNDVSDNYGNGVWLDASCLRTSVLSSTVMRNTGIGVHVEISGWTTVADNLVAANGTSGIKVAEANGVKVWNNTFAANRSNVDVIDGPRVATNASTPGHDPRHPSEPLVTWVVDDVTVRNNLLVASKPGAISLLGVEDGNRALKGAQMVSADHNGYYRVDSATPKWVVNWANYGGSPSMQVHTSLSSFRSTTGMEGRGLEFVAGPDPFLVNAAGGDFRTRADSAGRGKGAPLPADVAAKIGRPAGVAVDLGRLGG